MALAPETLAPFAFNLDPHLGESEPRRAATPPVHFASRSRAPEHLGELRGRLEDGPMGCLFLGAGVWCWVECVSEGEGGLL